MRKIKLNLEALNVESFVTAAPAGGEGTVLGHAQTNGQNTQCLSAIDACPTRLCDTNVCATLDAACQTLECDTVDPAYCPSAAFETCV